MINIVAPLLDTTSSVNAWTYVIPVLVSALTGGIVAILTKLLERPKSRAEERKTIAETKKIKEETEALENQEWMKLYTEIKTQYADLKKEFDLKMTSYEKQIGTLTDSLSVQEEETKELKKQLGIEKIAREKLESVLKKFQQWAVRNKKQLEQAEIEPVPVDINFY